MSDYAGVACRAPLASVSDPASARVADEIAALIKREPPGKESDATCRSVAKLRAAVVQKAGTIQDEALKKAILDGAVSHFDASLSFRSNIDFGCWRVFDEDRWTTTQKVIVTAVNLELTRDDNAEAAAYEKQRILWDWEEKVLRPVLNRSVARAGACVDMLAHWAHEHQPAAAAAASPPPVVSPVDAKRLKVQKYLTSAQRCDYALKNYDVQKNYLPPTKSLPGGPMSQTGNSAEILACVKRYGGNSVKAEQRISCLNGCLKFLESCNVDDNACAVNPAAAPPPPSQPAAPPPSGAGSVPIS